MRVAVYGVMRHLTYDQDWLDAILNYYDDAQYVDLAAGLDKDADLIFWLHSLTAQEVYIPTWLADRRGKLVILSGNDYKRLEEKRELYAKVGADLVGALAPNCPFEHSVHIPHGLNPRLWKPGPEFDKRTRAIGFRGYRYPDSCGDTRNRFVELFMDGFDVKWEVFLNPTDYRDFLKSCRATVATEAGAIGHKAISSRQFEAIGSKTALVMVEGEYSGCLTPEHYIAVKDDFSNVMDAIDRAMDPYEWRTVTNRALAHVLSHHTIDHRLKQIEDMLWP